jgi:hypothetical protein
MDQKRDVSGAKRGVKSEVPKTSKIRKTRKTAHIAGKKLVFSSVAAGLGFGHVEQPDPIQSSS